MSEAMNYDVRLSLVKPAPLPKKLKAVQDVYDALRGFTVSERHQITQLATSQLAKEGR